jgi:signal transduction histidine kinase
MSTNKAKSDIQQERLAALYQVSSQLGSSLDLSEVLNQVMDSIIELTGAERGYMVLYDETSGDLEPAVVRNVDQEKIEAGSLQVSRTVIEQAVATGKGIVTNNAQEDERFAGQESVVGFQLRSIMCAPLRVRNRILGAVYVDNRLFSGVFGAEDLNLLVAFTNQAAIAVQNARLFTQTDQALARRAEEISLFQRINRQLNKSLDLQRVLRLALDWSVSLTGADGGSIGLIEEGEESGQQLLRLLATTGMGSDRAPAIVHTDHPILARVLAEGESVVTTEVPQELSIDGTPAQVQLAVPVLRDGAVAGLITLESQKAGALDGETMGFVERLADRASVAINNARLYERIHAANKAKSDFVSTVTHELRLPMTAIRGYADLMNSGMAGPLSDQQKQFLAVIRRNLLRMSDLIRDLGDINRIESGRMKFESRRFAIHDTINDVAENLRESIAGRNQTLTIRLPDSLPEIYADPTRVSQILTNLLSNANKYTPDDGEIEIRVLRFANHISVSVIDNGHGISEEDQKKLFTQFFRAESQAVRQQQGWGLGLSIVKKMVEAQGGEVTFESALGKGSSFTFTVPLAKE